MKAPGLQFAIRSSQVVVGSWFNVLRKLAAQICDTLKENARVAGNIGTMELVVFLVITWSHVMELVRSCYTLGGEGRTEAMKVCSAPPAKG